MATLAESVMGGAQEAINSQQHTAGDAIQAYQVAQQAKHAEQELAMEKQNNDINKANYVLDGMSKAMNAVGPVRNAMLAQLKQGYSRIDPTADPAVFDVIPKMGDEDTRQLAWNLNQMATTGINNPDQAGHVLGMVGSITGFNAALDKGAQFRAQVEAGKERADSIAGPRLQMLGWNKHKAALDAVVNNKPIQGYLNGYQSIQNALKNYETSGGMPQELAQLQTSLRMNAGSNGPGGVAERAEGYASDLGISKDQAMQILTGKIQSADLSSPGIVTAIKAIASGELQNKQQQAASQIKKMSTSYGGVYRTDPYAAVNKPEFDSAVRQQYQQFGLDENGNQDVAGVNAAPANAGGTTAGLTQEPAVGTVMEGHRYKGGGAYNQSNWEPIAAPAQPGQSAGGAPQ